MNLFGVKKQYKEGAMPQKEYIDRIRERHASRFKYADYLQHANNDIQKIEMHEALVIIKASTNDIKIIRNHRDKRIAPVEILNTNLTCGTSIRSTSWITTNLSEGGL
jgi:hypothetical protein